MSEDDQVTKEQQVLLPIEIPLITNSIIKPSIQSLNNVNTVASVRQSNQIQTNLSLDIHQSQQSLKNINGSQSQSPASIKPRFSQYGLQNFETSKEKKLPSQEQNQKRRIVSNSPQIKTAGVVKIKQKKPKNQTGGILIGRGIKPNEQNRQQIVVKSAQEGEKRSIFNNVDGCYRYYVGWGNNEALVKKVMLRRTWWRETSESSTMLVNFKWQQSNRGYRYERLIISQNYKQLVNHFEHHREISNKQYLLQNLTNYCENHKLNVFDYTPMTFTLDFADDNCDTNVNQFLKIYEQFLPMQMKKNIGADSLAKYILDYKRKLRGHFTQGFYNYKDYGTSTKYKMNPYFITGGDDSKFLWLLKPTFLNRGRGIHVFSNLETLAKLISEYQEGYIEKSLTSQKKEDSEEEPESPTKTKNEKRQISPHLQKDEKEPNFLIIPENVVDLVDEKSDMTEEDASPEKKILIHKEKEKKKDKDLTTKKLIPQTAQTAVDPNSYIRAIPVGPSIIKSHSFVVQKYIEKPALINSRKFDVRVWALLTQDLDAYFFSEGYIRTSCEAFDANDTDNQFIHLTNNAIQKFSTNYGQFESGNQLSWKQYQEYLKLKKVDAQMETIVERMKELVWLTFQSIKRKMNFEERKFCFEIFGFDFIMDENHQVWLIEVNTNPCIEESSPLLQMLIPRMLDDAFKLTIDVLFPRSKAQVQISLKQSISTSSIIQNPKNIASLQTTELPKITEHKNEESTEWPVQDYPDDENMWVLLGTLNERRKQMIEKKRQWRSDLYQ